LLSFIVSRDVEKVAQLVFRESLYGTRNKFQVNAKLAELMAMASSGAIRFSFDFLYLVQSKQPPPPPVTTCRLLGHAGFDPAKQGIAAYANHPADFGGVIVGMTIYSHWHTRPLQNSIGYTIIYLNPSVNQPIVRFW
jgi:hypothetical protein